MFLKKTKFYGKISNWLQNDFNFKKTKNTLFIIIFSISLLWALCTQFSPGVDEGEIFSYAYRAVYEKQFDIFEIGHYMNRYPNQWGLFLFDYVLTALFGGNNFIAFEIVNSFAIALIYKELSEILELFGLGRTPQLSVFIVGILFIPISFYSIMVYGNIIGISLACMSIKYCIVFQQNGKLRNAIICAISISISVFFKTTMLIYLIALCLSFGYYLLNSRNYKRAILLVLIFCFYILQSFSTHYIIEKLSGKEMADPCSSWSYIAMGLQESTLAPGWWNSYIQTSYSESGGKTEVQKSLSINSIERSIDEFLHNKDYTIDFFSKKISSTWINPTFQCFATVRSGSSIVLPEWMRFLLTYNGQYYISIFLNLFIVIIYFGALLQLIIGYSSDSFSKSLIFPMIFIGGFIFLLFWETRSRYALMFFVPLIPYSIWGYLNFVNLFSSKNFILNKAKEDKFIKTSIFPCAILVIGIVCFLYIYFGPYNYLLNQDTEYYYEYLNNEDINRKII